jgi:ASC-1-like (ASCH) protein
MNHEMKLQPEYYNFILKGTKRIEIRLFDEKRQQIKIGDTIKFFKAPNFDESFITKVVGLLRYNTFDDMFKDFDISILADKSMTKEGLIEILEQFYTKEEQEQYGVLGIRIELKKEDITK